MSETAILVGDVLRRVRAEFLELPGLRLTRAQAARLWALDSALCAQVLSRLVDEHFLVCSDADSSSQTAVYKRLMS